MALSGSAVVAVGLHRQVGFFWEAAQSAQENFSAIAWELRLTADSQGRIFSRPGAVWSVTVDGQSFSGVTDIAVEGNATVTLARGSAVVNHNDDGSRAFAYGFTQEFGILLEGNPVDAVSGSGTGQLDLIPRASVPTLSADALVLGEALDILTNRASEGLTHRLELRLGEFRGTLAQEAADSFRWESDPDLARYIPGGEQARGSILCTTFLEGAQVGLTQAVAVTVLVPEGCVPTVEGQWRDVSGAYDAVGTLVAGLSRLEWDMTAQGCLGSTVTGTGATLDGSAYAGQLLTQGDHTLTLWAKDSRGRTGSRDLALTVADYQRPKVELRVTRCLEDGTEAADGGFARILAEGSVCPVGQGNPAVLTLRCGEESREVSLNEGQFQEEWVVTADAEKAYSVEATLADRLRSVTRQEVVPVAFTTLDLLPGGKGIAFGTSATREGFDCAMPAFFTGGISGALPAVESTVSGCYCRTVEQETEWIEPPMVPGTEYRTARRWQGKPVYVKALDLGALPESGSVEVSHGCRISQPVGLRGMLFAAGGAAKAASPEELTLTDTGTVRLETDWLPGQCSAAVTVEYVK